MGERKAGRWNFKKGLTNNCRRSKAKNHFVTKVREKTLKSTSK
jgi:hypothetical protein